jgi:hypothetical protein
MVQLDERHARGWDVLRLSTDALTVEIIPGLGGTMTSVTRHCFGRLRGDSGHVAAGHCRVPPRRR